jgi:hypothetical protein
LEPELAGPCDIRNEPILHDVVDLRRERTRVGELAEHSESERPKVTFQV